MTWIHYFASNQLVCFAFFLLSGIYNMNEQWAQLWRQQKDNENEIGMFNDSMQRFSGTYICTYIGIYKQPDITNRIKNAGHDFLFERKKNSFLKSSLLSSSETRQFTNISRQRIQKFINKCLLNIGGIYWSIYGIFSHNISSF